MADSTGFRFQSQQSVDRPTTPSTKRRNRKGLSLAVPATRPSINIDLHNNDISTTATDTVPPSAVKLIKQRHPGYTTTPKHTDNHNEAADKPYKFGPICILPYLYLGDENNANDLEGLKHLDVGYILNVAKEVTHPSESDFSLSDLSDEDVEDAEEEEEEATSPSLSISSSASSASSINTFSSSFSFGFNFANMASNSFRMSSPKELDDVGEHCPFSPRGIKPSPRGLRVLRFRPSLPSLSFASSFKATTRQDFMSHRQISMKRCHHQQRKLSHRISSSDMRNRRKRHGGGHNEVAQAEEGKQIKYKKFAWTHSQENLATDLGPALEVIDRARAAKRAILVHCKCGVARSASLVIAYVMHTFKISLNQAYDFVKAKSNSISPNMYLMFQLRDFETDQGLTSNNTTASSPSSKPTLRKCTSMQFNMTEYSTKDHHIIDTLVKLEPPAADALMLSRRSLDDSFYHSYSFRSEPPFTNDHLRMYL